MFLGIVEEPFSKQTRKTEYFLRESHKYGRLDLLTMCDSENYPAAQAGFVSLPQSVLLQSLDHGWSRAGKRDLLKAYHCELKDKLKDKLKDEEAGSILGGFRKQIRQHKLASSAWSSETNSTKYSFDRVSGQLLPTPENNEGALSCSV